MGLDGDTLLLGLAGLVAFLFTTTVHEAAHALVAFRLGDPTAYQGGQVTLNPWPHVRREPFGMVVVPILSFVLGGWMLGWASAPYDPSWAARHPRRAGWMALAGPTANLLLAVLAGFGIRAGLAVGAFVPAASPALAGLVEPVAAGAAEGLAVLLSVLFSLNVILFAFNLLPLPPLDGSGALPLLLPTRAAQRFQELMHQPLLPLLGILIAWQLFGTLFTPVFRVALALLYS